MYPRQQAHPLCHIQKRRNSSYILSVGLASTKWRYNSGGQQITHGNGKDEKDKP